MLRAIDHGWHPTGKAAQEAVHAQALRVVDRLMEFDFEAGMRPPRAGGPDDPWRQSKGPLPKMKFMKKTPKRFEPGLEKPKEKKTHPRFQWRPEEPTSEALDILLAEVDEIGSVPIPASAKRYARISGMRGLRTKQQNYINMCRDLGNRGKSTKGFPNHPGSDYDKQEGMDSAPVSQPLERGKVEKTKMGGGRYGKGVDPKGKTSGKFQFPGQWSVAHAIKS